MPSVVDICNSALNLIGASNILDLTEDSKSARICNQRYAFVRDATFRSHPWNCLLRRATLAPDTETPAFDFSKQFSLPNDPYCLRVLQLQDQDLVYKIEGRKILVNSDEVKVLYVARVEDPNEYDQLLVETIVARLASDIAYGLVNSASLMVQLNTMYKAKLVEARFVDANEGTPATLNNESSLTVAESNIFLASRL
ncbi:MAG: hypothetical protein Unbinned2189contig1000_45 [Prokaryotic dsDNA virus sp.]|nr:MAG: hypothetical protein Unbinned2189contig1000_45 [Prokaryotic dsDNA virus sp.]|tara:strand:+ start:5268 stop:5858 length:591 start_codon:yes stop_codon:yes gene_type:complete